MVRQNSLLLFRRKICDGDRKNAFQIFLVKIGWKSTFWQNQCKKIRTYQKCNIENVGNISLLETAKLIF